MAPTKPGLELTEAELERALADRVRIPLNETETLYVRKLRDRAPDAELLGELYEWFEAGKKHRAEQALRRERWAKRWPLIFGASSALLTAGTAIYHAWNFLSGHRVP